MPPAESQALGVRARLGRFLPLQSSCGRSVETPIWDLNRNGEDEGGSGNPAEIIVAQYHDTRDNELERDRHGESDLPRLAAWLRPTLLHLVSVPKRPRVLHHGVGETE